MLEVSICCVLYDRRRSLSSTTQIKIAHQVQVEYVNTMIRLKKEQEFIIGKPN